MPIYNLIEYSDSYSKIYGILCQYCTDEPVSATNSDIADFNEANATTKLLNLKAKITGETGNNDTKNVEIMVPLKYLSNFWRNLEMSLI